MAHGSTKDETIEEFVSGIQFGSSTFILDSMRSQPTSANSLRERLRSLEADDETFKVLNNYVVGMHVNHIIDVTNEYLNAYFTSVRYIAPLRASAERYYRIQGLSVDEIDPRVENIPMVLHHMEQEEKEDLNTWLRENFNFGLSTSFSGGHTSLSINFPYARSINLADMGFGYSQILPIILVLWQTTSRIQRKNTSLFRGVTRRQRRKPIVTLAIEQPELHLHPALQATLVDTFAKVIEMCHERDIEVSIIIETHSETILNRIGYLLEKNYHKLTDDQVNVLIFDNSEDPCITKVKPTGYSNGYLTGWPIGFFSPEEVR